MHTILMTRRLFPESELFLKRHVRLTRDPARAEGAITQLTDRIDERFFQRAPALRVVSQCPWGWTTSTWRPRHAAAWPS